MRSGFNPLSLPLVEDFCFSTLGYLKPGWNDKVTLCFLLSAVFIFILLHSHLALGFLTWLLMSCKDDLMHEKQFKSVSLWSTLASILQHSLWLLVYLAFYLPFCFGFSTQQAYSLLPLCFLSAFGHITLVFSVLVFVIAVEIFTRNLSNVFLFLVNFHLVIGSDLSKTPAISWRIPGSPFVILRC